MKTKFFAGLFLFVFLLAAVAQSQAQSAATTAPALTEDQQNALITQSAKKIKELKDKVDKAVAGVTENDVRGMIRKGTMELNGPAHKALKAGVAENKKAIEAMRAERQVEIAAQIIVARGIKDPTTDQIAKILAEADAILKISSLSERTKALAKAWTPVQTEDPRVVNLEKAVAVKATKADVDTAVQNVTNTVDGKIDKVRNDLMDFATTDQVAAVSVDLKGQLRDVQKTAEDANKKAKEVEGKVTQLQGEVQYAQGLAEATAGALVEVLKDSKKDVIAFYYRLSKNGACFADIDVTLPDIQERGIFGKDPGSVEEFQKILAEGFKDLKLTPAEAETRAKGLTAGMKEAK